MSFEEFKIKLFYLINWVLVLIKDFWTLTPHNQFYKNTKLKILLIKTFWWEVFWKDDNLPCTYEKHS
jgi:hypothetical protein